MSLPAGARRIRDAFDAAAGERPLLVAYVVAGFPDEAGGLAAATAALEAGADILEIGVPFSDPVADGPVIAAASHAAVAGGAGLETALRTVRALREPDIGSRSWRWATSTRSSPAAPARRSGTLPRPGWMA